MTKRVAIIGCSHTDPDQNLNDKIGWVEYLAMQYPTIEFHNFAKIGHGTLWYDIVLKHIIANYKNFFDGVIIQLTAKGRWLYPLRHNQDKNQWICSPFKNRNISNYYVHELKSQRIVSTQYGSFETGAYFLDKRNVMHFAATELAKEFENYYTSEHHLTQKYDNENYDNLALQYEDLFAQTLLELYAPHFNNLYYFTFFNSYRIKKTDFSINHIGNIGHELPFVQWAIEKYGEKEVALNFFNNTWHLGQSGEDVFFKEYILSSNIGTYLKDLT